MLTNMDKFLKRKKVTSLYSLQKPLYNEISVRLYLLEPRLKKHFWCLKIKTIPNMSA